MTRLRKIICVFTIATLWVLFSSIVFVFADVPTVLEIEAAKEGENTVLDIEIRHSSPSSTHYIDMIEIEINERLDRLTDLEPQTTTTFTYEHNIGVLKYETIRARAHCTIHGWSSWIDMEAQPEPPFIETPLGISIVGGGIAAVVAAILIVLKKTGNV